MHVRYMDLKKKIKKACELYGFKEKNKEGM